MLHIYTNIPIHFVTMYSLVGLSSTPHTNDRTQYSYSLDCIVLRSYSLP
jgi:hypothetical protein